MESPECVDAKNAERPSSEPCAHQQTESLLLSAALVELCQQIKESNLLMMALIQQNAALMEMLVPEEEEGTASHFDMEGKPVKVS